MVRSARYVYFICQTANRVQWKIYWYIGFTLTDPSCSTAGCSFNSGAKAGSCTGNAGTLSFAEIERVIAGGAKVTLDKAAAIKQVVWDSNQWVSYDDADTFKTKIDYADSKCLGGLMVVLVLLLDIRRLIQTGMGFFYRRLERDCSRKSFRSYWSEVAVSKKRFKGS